MSKPTAIITEWSIGGRGPNAIIGGTASFVIADLAVSKILQSAETAIQEALKEENIRGKIVTLELRIEFERRERRTETRISGHARLGEASQEPKP